MALSEEKGEIAFLEKKNFKGKGSFMSEELDTARCKSRRVEATARTRKQPEGSSLSETGCEGKIEE